MDLACYNYRIDKYYGNSYTIGDNHNISSRFATTGDMLLLTANIMDPNSATGQQPHYTLLGELHVSICKKYRNCSINTLISKNKSYFEIAH